MRSISAAIAWANAQKTWTPFSCLNFVYNAYFAGEQTPLGAQGISLPTAKSAWSASQQKVTDGSEPPVGALMYFDGTPGDPAGDVQIYTGNHLTRRTDVGRAGACGTVDWKWMSSVVGRQYLGWTRDILGAPTFTSTVTPSGEIVGPITSSPPSTVQGESEMYLAQATGATTVKGTDGKVKGNIDGRLFLVDPTPKAEQIKWVSALEATTLKTVYSKIYKFPSDYFWRLNSDAGYGRTGW